MVSIVLCSKLVSLNFISERTFCWYDMPGGWQCCIIFDSSTLLFRGPGAQCDLAVVVGCWGLTKMFISTTTLSTVGLSHSRRYIGYCDIGYDQSQERRPSTPVSLLVKSKKLKYTCMGQPTPPLYIKYFSTDLRKSQEGTEQKWGVRIHPFPLFNTPPHPYIQERLG